MNFSAVQCGPQKSWDWCVKGEKPPFAETDALLGPLNMHESYCVHMRFNDQSSHNPTESPHFITT